jgi:hypothetical protein
MAHDETVAERVQELTWALLDEQINEQEMQLLENLLLADDNARSRYIDCVQLHTDLIGHFANPDSPLASGKVPVLGFLGGAAPPVDAQPSA